MKQQRQLSMDRQSLSSVLGWMEISASVSLINKVNLNVDIFIRWRAIIHSGFVFLVKSKIFPKYIFKAIIIQVDISHKK